MEADTTAGKEGQTKSETAKREEETLAFWKKERIFDETLKQAEGADPFVFYDGPPFATGLPHYGHLLPGTIKDVIPRYQTMRGKYVRRQWGWDCHGLPIENIIEKEVGLNSRKDIEGYGIERFNRAAREAVLRYDKDWKEYIPRTGRFVDMEHPYTTMDSNYTESIWWAWKELSAQGLVYEGYKPMQVCPRCETTLSNFEVAQGYKDITDLSATVKFALVDEKETYILAWTTTPWTLPGNAALAVSKKIEYGIYEQEGKNYIVAESRAEKTLGAKPYRLIREISGEELVGKKYTPPFLEFYNDEKLENRENGWKVYAGDFVTDTDGTGIVHIAPAFGADDMMLGRAEKLPFIQHVRMNGEIEGIGGLSGMQAKPKEDPQKSDIEVVKYLAHKGLLFAKEKIVHPYAHCWRCDTPLLNYAASSWFIKVTDIKNKLISENKKIGWTPGYVGSARFANILEDAPDWAVSRARFWGAPIPVWKCDTCDTQEIVGSVEELKKRARTSGNTYFVMRHGFSESNEKHVVSNAPGSPHHLTEKGKEEAAEAAKILNGKGIDLIVSSPFLRTKETAEIIRNSLGLPEDRVIVDDRLAEIHTGIFDGKDVSEYHNFFSSIAEKFTKTPEGGENLMDVKRRAMAVLIELEHEHKGKKILIVTHEYVSWMLTLGAEGGDIPRGVAIKEPKDDFLKTGEWMELSFPAIPRNSDFELDLHRPYIDEITLECSCGGTMKRIPEVFDCWVESGSMPFAQFHYPFENKKLFEKNFPADFIAEGVDQTRGWFYSMLVLGTALFGRAPYKHVIVNGTVLAEDGQKMSKRLKNYPDITEIIERYGADALRFYLVSSPAVHAEDLRFSEKGVDEIHKKIILRLINIVSFYNLYKEHLPKEEIDSDNVLDKWISARFFETASLVTKGFDEYEIDRGLRPILDFVDDFSTWYVRRSRERVKGDDGEERARAVTTLRRTLLGTAKIIAPVMPFLAEEIYRAVEGEKKSVHLEAWPDAPYYDEKVIKDMAEVRACASNALLLRMDAGIKVRQPLSTLKIKNEHSVVIRNESLSEILKDEVNVKEVVSDGTIEKDIFLDTNITENLREEGYMRELVRALQDVRKKKGLSPHDRVSVAVSSDFAGAGLIGKFEGEIKRAILADSITFGESVSGETISLDGATFSVDIQKV